MRFENKKQALDELNNLAGELKKIFGYNLSDYRQKAYDRGQQLSGSIGYFYFDMARNLEIFKYYLNGGSFSCFYTKRTWDNLYYRIQEVYAFEGSLESRIRKIVNYSDLPEDLKDASVLYDEMSSWKTLMLRIKKAIDFKSINTFSLAFNEHSRRVGGSDQMSSSYFKTAVLTKKDERRISDPYE